MFIEFLKVMLCTIVGIFIIFAIGAIIYFKTKNHLCKRIYHDTFGWCIPDKEEYIGFDGVSYTCRCVVCRKRILQDSQGNWFSVED